MDAVYLNNNARQQGDILLLRVSSWALSVALRCHADVQREVWHRAPCFMAGGKFVKSERKVRHVHEMRNEVTCTLSLGDVWG